jgi:thiopeptide-type bacteriocin biosynthesis protein
MDVCSWGQVTIGFPDWDSTEHIAVTRVTPLLATAEADGLITAWFFIRKAPCWRVRYRSAHTAPEAQTHIHSHLADFQRQGLITKAVAGVYEPEVHAFGGSQAMGIAHKLWHRDSRHLMTYLARIDSQPDRRRELSILLYSAMLRAARLDWYEQGDVWARVADHRDPPDHIAPEALHALEIAVRRFISVDPASLIGPGAPLAFAADWMTAFTTAGRALDQLATAGRLHRGLREVLAHHIIFAWNRIGLPAGTQAAVATAATAVVFGRDPAAVRPNQHVMPPAEKER